MGVIPLRWPKLANGRPEDANIVDPNNDTQNVLNIKTWLYHLKMLDSLMIAAQCTQKNLSEVQFGEHLEELIISRFPAEIGPKLFCNKDNEDGGRDAFHSIKYVFSCGEKHCPPPNYRGFGPQHRLHCKTIIHICIHASMLCLAGRETAFTNNQAHCH